MKDKLERHRQVSESDVTDISSTKPEDEQHEGLRNANTPQETLELAHYEYTDEGSSSRSAASSMNSPPFIDPRALEEEEKEVNRNIKMGSVGVDEGDDGLLRSW